ncbi:MAG: mcrBC 5-methylcytosine restriction system component family protein [Planctomycetota bacterium]|nr:MAG: mcrBC 5-methylcytosine restriction system component family protein [Planctomycetota bacterium]
MTLEVVREFGRIDLSDSEVRSVRRLTERSRSESLRKALRWTGPRQIQVRSHVGVLRLGTREIEVRPKLPLGPPGAGRAAAEQRSLLAMLHGAGMLPPLHSAGRVGLVSSSLLDAFISAFVRSLTTELERGVEHRYHVETVNAAAIRGRIRIADDLRANYGLHHRCVQDRDLFGTDTPLNRVLKASCRLLAHVSRAAESRTGLARALDLLDDVADVEPSALVTNWPVLGRGTERFEFLLAFAKLLFLDQSPSLSGGSDSSFCLLFPMERVFESFIGRLLRRSLSLHGYEVQLQSGGFLLRDESERPKLGLRPDIVIKRDGQTVAVVDTKWKDLARAGGISGVASSDASQLLAYGHRWRCADTVLLYPGGGGDCGARLRSFVAPEEWALSIRFANLGRDLSVLAEREALAGEMASDLRLAVDGASMAI